MSDYRPYHHNPQWPYPYGTRPEDVTPALIENVSTAFLIDVRCRQYEMVANLVDMERLGRVPKGRAAKAWANIQAQTYGMPWKGQFVIRSLVVDA